ncbi:MAG: helix-turn-helix transcriptional regulator [Bacteroidia bacterium]|nr:helix-turn-helix transcriptional regulator [Bacteroidia bacterium]
MKSKILQEVINQTPKDVAIFVDKYTSLVLRINELLKEKGYSQKTLADKLDKKPSEIHKWLNGEHNFTLRSIAKLEAELDEILLDVPVRKVATEFNTSYTKTTYILTAYANLGNTDNIKTPKKWNYNSTIYELSNVG